MINEDDIGSENRSDYFICSDCNQRFSLEGKLIEYRDGARLCYVCAGARTKREMVQDGKACLYLAGQSFSTHTITDWTGSLKFKPYLTSKGRHNFAGSRVDVWFTGPDGAPWWGVNYGHNSMLLHCKRLKKGRA